VVVRGGVLIHLLEVIGTDTIIIMETSVGVVFMMLDFFDGGCDINHKYYYGNSRSGG